jgi:hypothetical protein
VTAVDALFQFAAYVGRWLLWQLLGSPELALLLFALLCVVPVCGCVTHVWSRLVGRKGQ